MDFDDTSPLASIVGKVKAKKESKHLDVRVDGLSDSVGHDVMVRYVGRAQFEEVRARLDKRRKSGRSGWELLASLDLMVDSCAGVYAVLDGKEYGMSLDAPTDPADWPRFDERLREVLPDGVGDSAVAIARGLFAAGYAEDERGLADWEVIRHGDELMNFYRQAQGGDDLGG